MLKTEPFFVQFPKPNVRIMCVFLQIFSEQNETLVDSKKILIGFSKGVVVLNQILHEISALQGNNTLCNWTLHCQFLWFRMSPKFKFMVVIPTLNKTSFKIAVRTGLETVLLLLWLYTKEKLM